MKKIIPFIWLVSISFLAFSQGLWEQKANFPASVNASVTFSINGKGFVYIGRTTNNFYMYDPSTNVWSQKANYPGLGIDGATGFSIDSFGYIGGGSSSSNFALESFYQYNPSTDTWTAKASLPDSIQGAFGFSLNSIGFIAGGSENGQNKKTTFAYDPSTNTWSLKDSMPFAMAYGVANIANGKGYCGFGKSVGFNLDSFYEYNPMLNKWQKMADYRLTNSNLYGNLCSFSINNKIYVGDPRLNTGFHGAVAVYDPTTNIWSKINTFPFPNVSACNPMLQFVGLTIGNRGFLGGVVPCSGSMFWEYTPNKQFSITTLNPDTLCEQEVMNVTLSSSTAFNSGNYFKLKLNSTNSYFNNGGFTDSVPGTSPGVYRFKIPNLIHSGTTSLNELVVYSTNPPSQTSYSGQTVYVKKSPTVQNLAPSYMYCATNSSMLLYRSNVPNDTHFWTSSPWGVIDSSQNLTFIPTQNTTLYVKDVNTSTGCAVYDTTVVLWNALPQLHIIDSVFNICPNSSVTLGGSLTPNVRYTWTGSGLNSTMVNPIVTPTANSVYNVLLTDTLTTCSNQGNSTVNIKVPGNQTICFVTVDSTSTHNVLIWEKSNKFAVDSFLVYRENSTNNYQRVAAIHRDSLSELHDFSANPNVTAYRYKISAKDTCGNESELSAYHNSIHLQYLGNGNLIWNVYSIENSTTPVNSFDVYRDSLNNGNWHIMLNVPGTQSTATDINFSQHPNAKYRVVANWAYSCIPSRLGSSSVLSNVISIRSTDMNNVKNVNNIQIFPSPAIEVLQIVPEDGVVLEVSVLSIDGKTLLYSRGQGNFIQVNKLAPGTYFVDITTNKGKVIKRFIKQ